VPVDDALHGLIGFSVRAGQLISGQEACLAAVRTGKAALVLVDAGSSENTQKRFRDASQYHQVTLHLMPPEAIARATGKPRMVVAMPHGALAERARAVIQAAENA